MFISDCGNHRVVVCDAATGRTLRTIGRGEGGGDGQFMYPCGLALSPSGRELFVADEGNNRVQVFLGADGSYLRSWGGVSDPRGLAMSPDGRSVFVSSFSGDDAELLKFK